MASYTSVVRPYLSSHEYSQRRRRRYLLSFQVHQGTCYKPVQNPGMVCHTARIQVRRYRYTSVPMTCIKPRMHTWSLWFPDTAMPWVVRLSFLPWHNGEWLHL